MRSDLHGWVSASAPVQPEMLWGRGKWGGEGESEAAKESAGQVASFPGKAAQWRFGLRADGEKVLGPPVEVLVTHPDLSTFSSALVLTQPWLRWQRRLSDSPPPPPNVSFELPKQDMPCVCLFLPWEIWYQSSAGMPHLFREGFFLK